MFSIYRLTYFHIYSPVRSGQVRSGSVCLEQFGTIEPRCRDGMDGWISLTSLTTRSPDGDNNGSDDSDASDGVVDGK